MNLDDVGDEPLREAVGAKAKTPPFARSLRRGRWSNGDNGQGHPSPDTTSDEDL